jgi:hypothetical protein
MACAALLGGDASPSHRRRLRPGKPGSIAWHGNTRRADFERAVQKALRGMK